MKNLTISLFAFAALLLLGSCSNDKGDNTGRTGVNSIFMKIEKQDDYSKRSIDNPAAETQVAFSEGLLYFVDASGVIKHRFTLHATNATNVNDETPGNNIKISDLTAGIEIKNILAIVKRAYIVGNQSLVTGYPTTDIVGNNISVVTGKALTYASVSGITSDNLVNATLFGQGDLKAKVGGTPSQFEVTVPVKPHIARIEIVDITGENGHELEMKEFNIKGVFLNNYYEELNMDHSQVSGKLKAWGAGGSSVYSNTNTAYPANMYDWSTDNFNNVAAELVKYADATNVTTKTKVWAFHVFTPTEGTVEFPHIILSVSNVVSDPSRVFDDPSFVTVRSFKKDDADEKAALEPGKIYRIKAGYFKFNPDNLFPSAELNSIDVKVNVSLLTWSIQGIKPEVE